MMTKWPENGGYLINSGYWLTICPLFHAKAQTTPRSEKTIILFAFLAPLRETPASLFLLHLSELIEESKRF
jgi:hypothetical protein